VTELPVFSDAHGKLYVQISHPGVSKEVRLSVPMISAEDSMLQQLNREFLVSVQFNSRVYEVHFVNINTRPLWANDIQKIGNLDESDSRNVLNNLVDILGYD
jgi:hypothetical protein